MGDSHPHVQPTATKKRGGTWKPYRPTIREQIIYRIEEAIDNLAKEAVNQARRAVPQAEEVEKVWPYQELFAFRDGHVWQGEHFYGPTAHFEMDPDGHIIRVRVRGGE